MINGGRTGTSQFLLNGAPISDKDGNWQLAPNVEAVQEFKVMTNTYDAQYGRFTGGVVNTTLKSGTNDWHGDVFRIFSQHRPRREPDPEQSYRRRQGTAQSHQFCGIVGGPIRKGQGFHFTARKAGARSLRSARSATFRRSTSATASTSPITTF